MYGARLSCLALAGAFLAAATVAGPAAAQTYDVELNTELNDLPVKIETVPMEGILVVKITNDGATKVRCDLRYDASPQPVGRAYVHVAAGRTEQDSFRAKRKWFDVVVHVTCRPADDT